MSVQRKQVGRGIGIPAGDLERRAENLCAHEFSHGDG